MRFAAGWIALAVIGALFGQPSVSGAAGPPSVVLTDVGHTLDGATLIVTGWVANHGQVPLSRLIIDVQGFAPSGDLATFGGDGIPWNISPGGAERFSVFVPVPATLVRDYTVIVSSANTDGHPLAGLRRTVDPALYRSLILSRVRLDADVQVGRLILRTNVAGLPVAQLTVEATLIIINPELNQLQSLTVAVPPDTTRAFPIGGSQAVLVSLRIVDLLLSTVWD